MSVPHPVHNDRVDDCARNRERARLATAERVLATFAHLGATACRRYELSNLNALNFVIENALQGGVNATLGLDRHGKTLSYLLLGEIDVTVPAEAVPEGSPYLVDRRQG